MSWQKITETCIELGPFRVFRYPFGDPEYFELWHGLTRIGSYLSAAEAKAMAEQSHRKAA